MHKLVRETTRMQTLHKIIYRIIYDYEVFDLFFWKGKFEKVNWGMGWTKAPPNFGPFEIT